MVDSCTVQRAVGQHVDPSTKQVVLDFSTIYAGRAKVQATSTSGVEPQQPGDAVTVVGLEVHLPVAGSEGIIEGDLITITSSQHDSDLVGRQFWVSALHHKSFATARRLPCVEVVN